MFKIKKKEENIPENNIKSEERIEMEREAKEYYLHNYHPMKREYQTMFCSFKEAAEWYKRDKDSAIFSNIAFAASGIPPHTI